MAPGTKNKARRAEAHPRFAPDALGVAHADDERITAHLRRRLGAKGWVFHEIVSDLVHIDVHVVPPSRRHPYHVLVTSGMSALPMTVPDTFEDPASFRFAELSMLLPPDWKLDEASLSDERFYWPIRLLKSLARVAFRDLLIAHLRSRPLSAE
jgi:hypothetical protein